MNYKNELLSIYPIINNIIENNTCEKGLLVYDGNTCYVDSVLMILLYNPNIYIKKLIYNTKKLSVKNSDKVYNTLKINEDNAHRIEIREIIKTIYENIQKNKNNRGISRKLLECIMKIRRIIKSGKLALNNFSPGIQADPIPFNEFILSALGIDTIKRESIIYVANNGDEINNDGFKKLTKKIRCITSNPFIDLNLLGNENKTYLTEYLIDDVLFTNKNNYYELNGRKYKRKIEVKSIPNTEILVFNIQRSYTDNVDGRVIIPNDYLRINNSDDILTLTGIVTRTDLYKSSGHYTSRILCNNEWYFYNDIGTIFRKIGSYEDMLKYNNTTNFCILCLYQKIR